jgi:hypothetical protein
MSGMQTTSIFSSQIAHRAGLTKGQLATEVCRYDLPIAASGPAGIRDNLYRWPALVRAIVFRRLRSLGLPTSRTAKLLSEIANDQVDAAITAMRDDGAPVWAVLALDDAPAGLFTSDSELREALGREGVFVFDLSDELSELLRITN